MSAIPCASVNLRTMADGTLRICLDIEPAHAQDAFKLFAAPGTPAAIAALQVGYAAITEKNDAVNMQAPAIASAIENPTIQSYLEKDNSKPKGGALSKLAGRWCQDPEFWAWSKTNGGADARMFILSACEIDSRSELDHNEAAAEKFHKFVRGPYAKYTQSRG